MESREKTLRQLIPLVNKDVNEAFDVPSTGQGVEQRSCVASTGTQGQIQCQKVEGYQGALGEVTWTIGTEGSSQVNRLGRG